MIHVYTHFEECRSKGFHVIAGIIADNVGLAELCMPLATLSGSEMTVRVPRNL